MQRQVEMKSRALACGILAALLVVAPPGLWAADRGDLGQVFESQQLLDHYGNPTSVHAVASTPLVVVAFLGVECPLARLYGPRLNEIHHAYADRGVAIVGVDSNHQDSLTEITAYKTKHQLDFPLLKDVGHRLADALGATRTPEVFVLDEDRQVRYHGRIDDQYGVGFARYDPQRSDLRSAIEDLLAGREVAVPETRAVGCIIGRSRQAAGDAGITFNRDIAPILHQHCAQCHRPGEIGPFPLLTFDDATGWEETILEVVEQNRMPPWNANPQYGHFRNDPRLSAEEIAVLRRWAESGAPQGDPQDFPPLPEFVAGWQIGKPDQVLYMDDQPFDVPAEGVVDYQRFLVDPGWEEDKYIVAAEARPDNREVVHHILAYIIPPGARRTDLRAVLVGYAPGTPPVHYGEDVALHVPAGSKLLFEMHYTPNGRPQRDRSYIGVRFTDKSNVKSLLEGQIAINTRFAIPPGAADHQVTADYRLREDALLLSMTPHMHLRGKSFRYEAFYPDGRSEILLDVPRYDFNWQLKYVLADPKLLPSGTRIRCTAVFDNSERNLVNPDPTQTVHWGDQSWEEMMIGFMDTLVPAR
ncbi:MAG: thiol-disulfide isomerase [Planctomycetota bacterium]|nr:MAG: thiol-disulfide isomerase [Planctomycetota bacterium]